MTKPTQTTVFSVTFESVFNTYIRFGPVVISLCLAMVTDCSVLAARRSGGARDSHVTGNSPSVELWEL